MTYGLCDYHKEEVHPFASVLLHPAEQLSYNSPRKQRFIRYRAAGVQKHTGLTFDEFLHRPPYMVEEMLEFCQEAENADIKSATSGLQALGDLDKIGQQK